MFPLIRFGLIGSIFKYQTPEIRFASPSTPETQTILAQENSEPGQTMDTSNTVTLTVETPTRVSSVFSPNVF